MSTEIKVSINQGKHGAPPPKGMDSEIKKVLERAKLGGEFKVLLGRRIRGSVPAEGVQVCNLDPATFGILMKVQVGGKDQRCEGVLYVSDEYRSKPQEFFERLQCAAQGVDYNPVLQETQKNNGGDEKDTEKQAPTVDKRRPSAVVVLKDVELIKLIMMHLKEFLGSESEMDKLLVQEEIEKQGLKCPAKSAMKLLISGGYLVEDKKSYRKSNISLTEKSLRLIGAEKKNAEDHLAWLRSLCDTMKEHERVKHLLESIKARELELQGLLEQATKEREALELKLSETSEASALFAQALEAVGQKP